MHRYCSSVFFLLLIFFLLTTCNPSHTFIIGKQHSYSSKQTVYFEDYLLKVSQRVSDYEIVNNVNEDSIIDIFKDILRSLNINKKISDKNNNRITEDLLSYRYNVYNREKVEKFIIDSIASDDNKLRLVPFIEIHNRVGMHEKGNTFSSLLTLYVYILQGERIIYYNIGVNRKVIENLPEEYFKDKKYRNEVMHTQECWDRTLREALDEYVKRMSLHR